MRTELLLQSPILLSWVGPLLLCPSELARVPDEIPGVYLLYSFAPVLGGYPVWYVGQTNNIRRRLRQHLSDRSAKPAVHAARDLDRPYWSAAPVLDPSLLGPVESGLIRALCPVCNDQVPSAKAVLVNLPPLTFRTVII